MRSVGAHTTLVWVSRCKTSRVSPAFLKTVASSESFAVAVRVYSCRLLDREEAVIAPNERHLFHFLELPGLLGPGLGDDIGLEHAPSRNVAVMFTDFG